MRNELCKRMNEQTLPSPQLIEKTVAVVCSSRRTSRALRPVLALTLALAVCLGGFSALAAGNEEAYQFLYRLSPALAQSLKPVRKACEDQGIRMEVVSVALTDNTADIVVSLEDLVGNRLDATIDLFDSYSIHRSFGGSAGCSLLGYDAATQTAYLGIHIEEQDGTPIAGSKITFSISRLLGQKTDVQDEPIPLLLDGLAEAPAQRVRLSGWGANAEHYLTEAENADYPVLVPQGTLYEFGGGMELSAIGLVNGRLHVQLAVRNNLNTDNHGFFKLCAADGTVLMPALTVQFNNAQNLAVPERIDYSEAVFDFPQDGLTKYQLLADHSQSGMLIEGNWQVTFQLENN